MSEPPSDPIRFVLDGEPVEVQDGSPQTTLLDFLRLTRGLTGTKEGCGEGDCGACTVAVAELEGSTLRWRALNACLCLLPTVDGKEVVTVQGLAAADGALHPVQQAMVEAHGSQCGFCTPGFVMSLFTHYQELGPAPPTRAGLLDALSGNLCRCTGYRPIIDAGLAMKHHALPPPWSDPASDAARVERLRGLRRTRALRRPGFIAPRTVEELATELEAHPQSQLLAGGTDVGLWVTKQLRELPPIVYLGEVGELQRIETGPGELLIGAAVRLEEALQALAREHPALGEMARRFASRPIRNAGTLVGNLANGSPIGDSTPALIALGATVILRRGAATRALPLEDLYLGYQRKDLAAGEFVQAVRVPRTVPGLHLALYKVAKRFDQDISAICAGLAVRVAGGRVAAARLAFGGMAATPRRAGQAEAALTGAPWSAESIEAAARALSADFTPISDLRASGAYRAAVAANLLRRFWLEQGTGAPPLDALAPVAQEAG